ncbi:Hypothetical predicted protein [Drosophila guanche]|uniref:Uncharacterized protein n=1 Tax=Drosophila guanche TaxID=7266 RepID=A0A3B0K5D7_DROGU|nr:Hypothetical predicted protein [Drosophila guanche]
MKLDARLSLSFVVLLLVGAAKARPHFDKIAGALIDALEPWPQYHAQPPRPGHAYGPGPGPGHGYGYGPGPLIQEGYEQGYDHYYGGGGGYGYGYQQGPPPGAYGYYPPPAGYYPHRPQEPYPGHPPRDRGYSQDYGRSVGRVGTPASTGGYKQRGY